jgi:hypothetical protein
LAAGSGVVTALAGCSSVPVPNPLSDSEPTIDAEALEQVTDQPVPSVPTATVVSPSESYLAAVRDGVQETLAVPPDPVTATDVPNGAIRRELERAIEDATEDLSRAETAESTSERFRWLQSAREPAARAAGTWRAIEGTATVEAVRTDAAAVLEEVDRFRTGAWEYVGTDPIEAVIVHARLESLVEWAIRRNREVRRTDHTETVRWIGDLTSQVVEGRGRLSDARHLYRRYRATLEDPPSVRSRFAQAGTYLSSVATNTAERLRVPESGDVPTVDGRDLRDEPIGTALEDLSFDVTDVEEDIERERRLDKLATVVLTASRHLRAGRAYESLRRRVESDSEGSTRVETAGDVAARRSAAVSAVESVLEPADAELLNYELVSPLVRSIDRADRELTDRYDGSVPASRLSRQVGTYLQVEALARETVPTSSAVAAALSADG